MKNRKKNTKLVLLLLLVCITLGYAALRTGLNINGTANVSSSSWNVHFENYQMSNATNITPTTEPTISGTTTTSISYEVDLDVPGDLYEFSVEVVNSGSMDALISLVSKYNDTEIDAQHPVPAYITYTVTDENGDPIVDDHRLDYGDREIVKVFVKYRDDDPSVLPSSNATLSFDLEIEAEQAPKATQPALTGVFTVSHEDHIAGQPIPQGVNIRSTPEAAIADWTNLFYDSEQTKPIYLKSMIGDTTIWCFIDGDYNSCVSDSYYTSEAKCLENLVGYDEIDEDVGCSPVQVSNAVVENYVGFIITNEGKSELKSILCSDNSECEEVIDNFVNGTYYLRALVDESDDSSKPVFIENKNVIKEAFNYTEQSNYCSTSSSSIYCDIGNFSLGANDDGYVDVRLNGGGCISEYVGPGYTYCF